MDYKDLDVWRRAVDSVVAVYSLIAAFPDTEKYGLVDQIKRAAVSIPSNIAEGAGRQSEKQFIHFLHVASGSASELETQIIIAQRLGFLASGNPVLQELNIIRKQLNALIKSLRVPHEK